MGARDCFQRKKRGRILLFSGIKREATRSEIIRRRNEGGKDLFEKRIRGDYHSFKEKKTLKSFFQCKMLENPAWAPGEYSLVTSSSLFFVICTLPG